MDEDDLTPDVGLEGVDAPVADEQQPEEQHDEPQSLSVDDLATEMGWTPKDKWRGDPDKWRPAADFLKRTVDVNRSLSTEVKTIKQTLDSVARTSATLTQQALEKQREKLLAERQEAFETGDQEAFVQAEKKLEKLEVEAPPPPILPETQEFVERNKWFGTDPEATNWARNRAGELGKQGIGAARQLQIVEREAKGLFPELFPAASAKPKPAPLSKPGARGSAPQAKGFASLPEAAKKVAIDYENRLSGVTREDFAKIYYEEQGQ